MPKLKFDVPDDTPTALTALYDAYSAALDGFMMVFNMPRCGEAAVSELIENEREELWLKMEAVAARLGAIQQLNADEADAVGQRLADWEYQKGEGNHAALAAVATVSAKVRPEREAA